MRFHSLDSLRAAMMLLGLVLHAAMSYIVVPFPVWRLYDSQRNSLFDLLILWIHVFRMPVFFVVAGFFANLVWEKYGRGGFIRNRGQRVALVLALILLPMYLATFVAFKFGNLRFEPDTWSRVWASLNSPEFLGQLPLMHLWFLYYLLLFYGVTILLKRWGSQRLDAAATVACAWTLTRPWPTAVLLGAPTALLLMTMPKGVLMTAQSIWPIDWNVFAIYLLFFVFGWYTYPNRSQLAAMTGAYKTNLSVGTALVFSGLPFLKKSEAVPVAVIFGAATWLLIFGMIGLFTRWLNRPMPTMRYLSDAAYWLYIAHIPVFVFGVAVLLPAPWSAAEKFSVVLCVGTGLLLTTYHLFVRNTWIGVALNGRRADEGARALQELSTQQRPEAAALK